MKYNFEKFLHDSKKECKSKADFIKRINNETDIVLKENAGQAYFEKQLYFKRLYNAKFCIENGAMKENDTYNEVLLELLDRLEK